MPSLPTKMTIMIPEARFKTKTSTDEVNILNTALPNLGVYNEQEVKFSISY